MNERTSKYKDDFSRQTALKILKSFNGGFKKYKFDDGDPSVLVFRFYTSLIKHDPKLKRQTMPVLMDLLDKLHGTCRMFVDQMVICIEITVPRPREIMKQKLFENVGGNRFVLTESVSKANLIREAVKKIFSSKDPEISYKKIQNVGLGYMSGVTEARKCALEEAKSVAKECGYADDQYHSKFIKEDGEMSDFDRGEFENGRPPVSSKKSNSNPSEAREVQIIKEILRLVNELNVPSTSAGIVIELQKLANELLGLYPDVPPQRDTNSGGVY